MAKHKTRSERREAGEYIPATIPKTTLLIALLVLIAIGAATTVLDGKGDRGSREVLRWISMVVPILATAVFAERASRDIRNGTVVAKTKEGARAALEEHGPDIAREGARAAIQEEQVMTRVGPAVTAELAALTELVLTNRGIADTLDQRLPQSRPTLINPPPAPTS